MPPGSRARSSRRRFLLALAASPGLMRVGPSMISKDAAAQPLADRPIRLVVGVPAGSGADLSARVIAEALEADLGQRVLVDNRPGADGIIAVRQVTGAPPDGTTLLFGLSSQFVVNPATRGDLPYDPLGDLVPISQLAFQRTVLATHPSLPVATAQELVAWTRAHPGTVSYSSGTSTFMLMAEAFKQATGADLLHVPFSGSGAAVLALVAGTVQSSFALPNDCLPHASAGRLRVLAVSGGTRMRQLPDTPTFAELGVRDEISVWTGLFAPAGTPASVTERIRDAAVRSMALPKVRENCEATGQDAVGSTAGELAAIIRRDIPLAKAIAKRSGVVPR